MAEEAIALDRVNDRLQSMEERLGPLKEQAEAAGQYLALEEELKVYEINGFLDQYQQYKNQYDKADGELQSLLNDLEIARRNQEEAKERSRKLAEEAENAGQTAGM